MYTDKNQTRSLVNWVRSHGMQHGMQQERTTGELGAQGSLIHMGSEY